MREPQATSRLGTLHALVRTGAICVSLAHATMAQAQIRSRGPVQPDYGWWISGGASATVLNNITDGATHSAWKFGSDPVWQTRATLEKSLDEFSTIGVSAGYGRVNLDVASIASGTNAALPTKCQTSCAATTQLWTGMLQFRSGGGEGFHTLFEAAAGTTVFRDFRTRRTDVDSSAVIAMAGIRRSLDLSGTLGLGFGYALSRGMVVALVQDAGIGFHSKTDLPAGTGRTWRMRNTRASIRVKF
jgi:hypothetical protein